MVILQRMPSPGIQHFRVMAAIRRPFFYQIKKWTPLKQSAVPTKEKKEFLETYFFPNILL